MDSQLSSVIKRVICNMVAKCCQFSTSRLGIITAMSQSSLPKPEFIDKQADLRELILQLTSQPQIAIDTESNSLFAYQEQVCLIQISFPDHDYLLDAITLPDLSPLAHVFANTKVEKVIHAAEYDLRCLKRDFGFQVINLFDTRTALRTLGRARTGLGNVLADEFGVKLNKRWQRANWGQRPLPAELLDYARLDTHYLLQLRDRLALMLNENQQWEEAAEEFKRLTTINVFDVEPREDRLWKIQGARKLKPREMAVLQEVYIFREQQAKRLDRPHFKVLADKTLTEIAKTQPKTRDELGTVYGMTKNQIRRFGKGLLAAVDRGHKRPPPHRPKSKRHNNAAAKRYKRLHAWRKKTAEKRGVDSDIILPREIVEEIANLSPKTLHELQAIMQPLEWRFQKYADDLLKLIHP